MAQRRVSKELSELVDAGALTGDELVYVVKQGVPRRTTVTKIGAIGGTPGADGATILSGSGAPDDADGNDGDHYIDTDTGDLYLKTSGTWGSAIGNLTGPQGGAGNDGADAYVYIAYASDGSGTGFTTTFNASLDYIAILATDTEIASPQASDFAGLWKNYKGATGATGATGAAGADGSDGADGADGSDGATWYTGTADPDSGTGIDGDFYLQTGTGSTGVVGDVWTKASGSWSITGNIRGAAGAGSGDMEAATYDPNNVQADAFAMDNMVEGTDTKILTAAERTKLAGIEAGATGDQSASEILTAIKTVDGSGSGLDADLFDGNEASAFATAAQGALADSALQSSDIGTNVQAWDADLDTWATKTPPSGTVVGTSDTQTLSNKTLTQPTIDGSIIEDAYTITDGAGFAINPTNGSVQKVTLGAARTPTVSGWTAGQSIVLLVDDGSAYAITWTTISPVWMTGSGAAPTLKTSGWTAFVIYYDGTNYFIWTAGDTG